MPLYYCGTAVVGDNLDFECTVNTDQTWPPIKSPILDWNVVNAVAVENQHVDA